MSESLRPSTASPPDPERNDRDWRDLTRDSTSLCEELMNAGEVICGQRSPVPLRITEHSSAPSFRITDGIAYVRVGRGVGSDPKQLRFQIALEIIHALLGTDPPETNWLEEGFTVYFARKHGGGAGFDVDARYQGAFDAVSELFELCPHAIKNIRRPPRQLRDIELKDIKAACPSCSDELAARLLQRFKY